MGRIVFGGADRNICPTVEMPPDAGENSADRLYSRDPTAPAARPLFSALSETWAYSAYFVASPVNCRNPAVRVDSGVCPICNQPADGIDCDDQTHPPPTIPLGAVSAGDVSPQINETSLLSADDEHHLAIAIGAGDAEARDRMVRANLRLVVNIARGYTARVSACKT